MDMEWFAHVAQHFEQRHIGHLLSRYARKNNIGIGKAEGIRFGEHRQRGVRQRHHVRVAPLHVIGRNGPEAPFQIEFGPCREPNLLTAHARKNQQLERQPPECRLAMQSRDEVGHRAVRHRLAILARFHLAGQSAPGFQAAVARGSFGGAPAFRV